MWRLKSQYKPLGSKDHQGVCYETFRPCTCLTFNREAGQARPASSKVNVLESNFLFSSLSCYFPPHAGRSSDCLNPLLGELSATLQRILQTMPVLVFLAEVWHP